MSADIEILILPQVTVQHDIGSVMEDIKEGAVLAEDVWISCYGQGAKSVHGKANLSLSNDDSSKFVLEGREGINATWTDRYSFQVSCPSLNVKKTTVKLPRSTFGETKAQTIPKAIQAFDISPNGALFVTGIDNGSISVQSTSSASGVPRTGKPHVSTITTLRFFPSNEVILAGSLDMSVSVISATDLSVPRKFKGHSRAVTDTAIIEKGRNVVSCAKDGTVRLWDVGGNKQIKMMGVESWSPILKMAYGETPQGLNAFTEAPTYEPADGEVGTQGKLLCCALQSGRFTLLDLGSKNSTTFTSASSSSSSPALHSIALSGNHLATGSANGLISLYDIRKLGGGSTGEQDLLFRCKRNDATIEDLSFVAGGNPTGGIPDLLVATVDGLPFRLGCNGDRPMVLEELAGNDCDPVRVVRAVGAKVWTAGDDGVVRCY